MTVWHHDAKAAGVALDAAFAEIELIEDVMSLYRPGSQLCRLNREGTLAEPHPHLVTVLLHAADVAERTGGAFDVTVQPLWDLYQAAMNEGRLPSESEVAAARRRVDFRQVQVSEGRIDLAGSGAAVTLNGIAQGYAADVAMAVLRRAGVAHALIDTGETGAIGDKPDSTPWTVGIQHPRQRDAFISLAKLRGRCLATSGDYETRFSDDFANNHVFDPRTGHSPAELASASVAASTAMEADALSTAVFVLGLARGLELVNGTPGVDALFVTKDGRVTRTAGFPAAA